MEASKLRAMEIGSTATGKRWSIERQVRVWAGFVVLTGTILSVTLHPLWVYLSMFAGAMLIFAALTDLCPVVYVLRKMPWNRTS